MGVAIFRALLTLLLLLCCWITVQLARLTVRRARQGADARVVTAMGLALACNVLVSTYLATAFLHVKHP